MELYISCQNGLFKNNGGNFLLKSICLNREFVRSSSDDWSWASCISCHPKWFFGCYFIVLVFSKSKTWYTFLPFGVLKHDPRCEFWTASFKKETFKSHHLIFKIFIKVRCWVHYQFKGALRQVHTCISVYLSGEVAHRLWKQMYLLKEAFFLALLKMLHSVFLVLDWLWGIKVRLSLSGLSQCWNSLLKCGDEWNAIPLFLNF